ncbi:magnesium transporter [Mycena alexandri]|uniref:Magnesium transporter n=1 Tax=Mycena alexandri TaxID=1745969 RepID=A0AAD6SV72_9AGAR|nr:magnesium transporter [Mycena alexandri]
MPRENSFSDSDGRSLTPDLEDQANPYPPTSPNYPSSPLPNPPNLYTPRTRESVRSLARSANPHPPIDRFRHAVRKVIALHRGAAVMTRRAAGAEPGIDPRSAAADLQFEGVQQECVIEVADYSAVRTSFGRMTNREFIELMNDPTASKREPWVKVRWINIAGLSWDVVKAVSIKYDLHPLALEDVFHSHSRARSKADYYARHLFLRVLCHELGDQDQDPRPTLPPRPQPPTRADSDDEKRSARRRRNPPSSSAQHSASSLNIPQMRAAADTATEQRRIQDAALAALKSGERVNVNVVPMCIFLFRDGTVISIHSTPSLRITEPITNRLRQFDTGLRTSADASLLVQSLLALVADNALEVVNAYQEKIKKFERSVMVRPSIETVRNLHILSADLILHRRTLAPIKTVVYGLRRYDLDRAAAFLDPSAKDDESIKVAGFMSHATQIYLADVHDHMEYVLSQLDVIAGIGQNLGDYTFNMTSYEMNEVMRRLMLVTVIFLPLTLLTGYFGMNFTRMWTTTTPGHSDSIYWIIALPIEAIILPLFLGPDIKRLVHYMQKRILTKRAVESVSSA